jgi:DNA topoisomerase-3
MTSRALVEEKKPAMQIIWKNMAGRQFARDEVRTLLASGRTLELEGFRSKLGRPFKAVVKLGAATEFKQNFDFGDSDDPAHKLDFSILPVLAKCPLCENGTIHDTGSAWQCSNTPACKFRMGKTLCQREVPREQVKKLLAEGRTALIQRFISKKGRPFSAFLTLDKVTAKVGFEFEPRKPAAKKPPAPTLPQRNPATSNRPPSPRQHGLRGRRDVFSGENNPPVSERTKLSEIFELFLFSLTRA